MAVRKYIWLILLACAVLGLTVVSAVVRTRAAEESIGDRSTYRFNTLGTRAVYETLRRLGYRVQRRRDDLRSVPEDAGELWIIYPTHPFDREEIGGLRRWVVRGNTLVCAYDVWGFELLFGYMAGWETRDGQRRTRGRGKEFEELASIVPEVGGIIPPVVFGPELKEPKGERLAPRSAEGPVPSEAEGLAADVRQIYIPNRLRAYPPDTHTEVVGDTTGSVVLIAPVEEGRIVFISDPDIFANKYLLEEDNAILAANIALLGDGKKILFDEFHHGFEKVGSLPQLAWASASRWGVAQMALAGILLLITLMMRFGRALPMPVARRRRTGEYVESLAEVYHTARAREVAVWTFYQFARRRLAVLVGLPPEAEDDLLAQQAASRIHRPAEEIREALAEARRLSAACPDDEALVRVAQNLRRIAGPSR